DRVAVPSLLYRPLQVASGARAPGLLWIHGGPGGQSRVGYNPFVQYLANHGYAVLAVNNRGSGGYGKTFDKLDDQRHGEADLDDPNGADSVRLYRMSPLFHADQIRKPLLVLQGANDPRVLKVESDQIVEAVRHRGGVAEYVVFPDEGHGFIKKANNITAYRTA